MIGVTKSIVIAGGGIIGNSIAYYLSKSQQNIPIILVDPVGIAPGASSTAGGFLAKTWRDGTPLEEMQRVGFELHQELAIDLGSDRIGYRRLTCLGVEVGKGAERNGDIDDSLEWVDLNVVDSEFMGDKDGIAQVHPRKLCEAMWEFSENSGAELKIGRIVKALTETNKDDASSYSLTGVELEDGSLIEADTLVVACGPWSEEARSWFPSGEQRLPEVTGVKCHSMLVQPSNKKTFEQAVFFQPGDESIIREGDEVEVYPRPDGDCYVNGFEGKEEIVKERPGNVVVEDEKIEQMKEAMRQTSSQLADIVPHTTQACYWPETKVGLPCVGSIPGIKGAFVATGHSVWGILQGPSTGKAMAELLTEGKSVTLDLSVFDVRRF